MPWLPCGRFCHSWRSSPSVEGDSLFFDGDHLKSLLEKAMATRSSTLAWKIPWTEDPAW